MFCVSCQYEKRTVNASFSEIQGYLGYCVTQQKTIIYKYYSSTIRSLKSQTQIIKCLVAI